jgi:hypothetical protein
MHTGRRHGREALHDVAMTVGENGSERTLPTVSVAYQLKVNLGLAGLQLDLGCCLYVQSPHELA